MTEQDNCMVTSHGKQRKHDDVDWDANRIKKLFGFSLLDLSKWDSFIQLMCRPADPAGLGVMRVLFGFLMTIDIWQERGLSNAVQLFGDYNQCRFPLFDFIKPLPLVWMYIIYFVMLIGELGIMFGFLYHLSCVLFVTTYWYLYLLNKTSWNNHSYLFGLMGILFLIVDGNRYWSVDGLIFKNKRHAHVPLWNYAILRFQIFILYFIAGLKKLDMDWVLGYSMHSIAGHYVFAPFRLLMSEEQVSIFVVHLGGLIIDLFMGFLLFFDKTRPVAFLFGASFHLMNSQLFTIGMFPWMMLATLPLFCHTDWPRGIIQRFPTFLRCLLPADMPLQTSKHCIYEKSSIKPDNVQENTHMSTTIPPNTRPSKYHKLMVAMVLCYVVTQCVLPYSHNITKGYNHWTQGLYGYSWDMMVHTWNLQHVKVTYFNKDTNTEGYLNPKAWTQGARWSTHPDMIKQYARCVQEKLAKYNMTNIELRVDIWRSLNDRFQQRAVDPRVNLLETHWSPFSYNVWLLPLLVDLSDWRSKLSEIQSSVLEKDNDTDVVFVADFPGLYLENYIQEDLGDTSITVLKGQVIVELVNLHKNVTLNETNTLQVPAGQFHNVHTVSNTPSCYMYKFVNTTDVKLRHTIKMYKQILNGTFTGSDSEAQYIKTNVETGPKNLVYKQLLDEHEKSKMKQHLTFIDTSLQFLSYKYMLLQRSMKYMVGAIKSILTGESFDDFLNATITEEMILHTEEYSVY